MSYMTSGLLSHQIPTVIVMLCVIIVVGSIGNLLVVIVYSLKQDKLNASLFILVLAMSDLLCCLTSIPITVYIEYVEWKLRSEVLCKAYYFLNNSFIPFSSLLITCIAFDRYFCLCHPFARILTLARAKRMIGVVVAFAVLIGVSSTFTVRILEAEAEANQTAEYECSEIIMINTTKVEVLVYHVVQKTQIASYILCIISVIVLYILIYRSVSKVYKKRKALKGPKTGNIIISSTIEPTTIIGTDPAKDASTSVATSNDKNGTIFLHPPQPGTSVDHTKGNADHKSGDRLTVPGAHSFKQRAQSACEIEAESPSSFTRGETAKLKRSIKHLRDTTTFQNLKTASMLFVVAVLYIVTFMPGVLMANKLITLYLPVFYMYYINNAINPIVYGFMNPSFRQDIQKLLFKR